MADLYHPGWDKESLYSFNDKSPKGLLRTYTAVNLHVSVLEVATGIRVDMNVRKVSQRRPS